MKHIATLLAALFSCTAGYSQCTQIIYAAFPKIMGDTSFHASGTGYWVCEGVNVTILSSPGSAYYLEANAVINIVDSDGDAVYAKDGCTINNSSDATIGVVGNTPALTLNNTGSGMTVMAFHCNPLTYDYSMVGGGPCLVNSVEEIDEKKTSVYPNPIKKGNAFTINSGLRNFSYEIFDITGNLIRSGTGSAIVETAEMNTGYYFLKINSANNSKTIRLVVL